MFIIDDILLSPLNGIIWLGGKLDEYVDKEMSDAGRIKEKLMALQLQFEMDEISEITFSKREKELLALLDRIYEEKENETL